MKVFKRIIDNTIAAKSKKGLITSGVIAIIIFAVVSFIFGGGGTIIGILLSAVVFVGIGAGMYFWLRAADDLPEALD